MKKSFLFLPLALALWSCSDNDMANNPGQNNSNDRQTSFIAVNISNLSSSNTRAEDHTGHPYDDGLDNEWAVTNIKLFFFGDDNNLVNCVSGNSYFKVVTPENGYNTADPEHPNVTADVNAVIALSSKAGDDTGAPTKILAVVNPSGGFAEDYTESNRSPYANDLEKLLAQCNANGYTADSSTTGENNTGFIMANSVYNDGTNNHILETINGIYTTENEAKSKPTKIYVERMVAKASLKINSESLTETTITEGQHTSYKNFFQLPLSTSVDKIEIKKNATSEEKQEVYIHLLGWNVTATANKGYIVKNIGNWSSGVSGADGSTAWTAWNNSTDHRSYWAVNPSTDFSILYDDFDDASSIQGFKDKTGANDNDYIRNYTYMNENAFIPTKGNTDNGYKAEHFPTTTTTDAPTSFTTTKVIVAAELCDDKGNPLTITKYQSQEFIDDEDNSGLLGLMGAASNIYVKGGGNGSDITYTPICNSEYSQYENYLKIYSNQQVKDKGYTLYLDTKVADRDYYVYALLNEEAAGISDDDISSLNLVIRIGTTDTPLTTKTQLNKYLIEEVSFAKVWQEGQTYYSFEIKHLNSSGEDNGTPGYFGVIRNHWYESTISAIYGLGTPVFDSSDQIYPQTPEDDPYTYVAAEIKILSWHKVQNSYVLGGE